LKGGNRIAVDVALEVVNPKDANDTKKPSADIATTCNPPKSIHASIRSMEETMLVNPERIFVVCAASIMLIAGLLVYSAIAGQVKPVVSTSVSTAAKFLQSLPNDSLAGCAITPVSTLAG
jgi:hypothetical protein